MPTDREIQMLDEFVMALKDADEKDNESFTRLLNQGVGLFGLSHKEIAEHCSISRPSVTRWINGKNTPHPAMRPRIYRWLQRKATTRLRSLATVVAAVASW